MAKIDEALESFKKRDYEHALDLFSSIVEKGEESAEIYNNIGLCYYNLGNFEKAEEFCQKAIKDYEMMNCKKDIETLLGMLGR